MLNYITHKRFKNNSLSGYINLPAQTECSMYDGIIFYNFKPICYITSEVAHQYFAINDDGNGMLRGNLTQLIQKILSKRDKDYQARWNKIWQDPFCQQFKRIEHADVWLWNHDFFDADIEDLEYIYNLIK